MNVQNYDVILYGSKDCHKTKFYIQELNKLNIPFIFKDVVRHEKHAAELRNLYESGKLNFPTITIGSKRLRNPSVKELKRWLDKLLS